MKLYQIIGVISNYIHLLIFNLNGAYSRGRIAGEFRERERESAHRQQLNEDRIRKRTIRPVRQTHGRFPVGSGPTIMCQLPFAVLPTLK